nr:hypothetical protein K-LCC10_0426 [Kaumoebavirus]
MSHTSVLPNITDKNLKPEFMNEPKPEIPKGPNKADSVRPEEDIATGNVEASFFRKNWVIITLIVVVIILICVIIWLMTASSNTSSKRPPPQRQPPQQPQRRQPPVKPSEPVVEEPEEAEVADEPTHEDLVNNKDLTADIKVERVPIPPLEDESDEEEEEEAVSKIIEIHD